MSSNAVPPSFATTIGMEELRHLLYSVFSATGIPMCFLDPAGTPLFAFGALPPCFGRSGRKSPEGGIRKGCVGGKGIARGCPIEFQALDSPVSITQDGCPVGTLELGPVLRSKPQKKRFLERWGKRILESEPCWAAVKTLPILSRAQVEAHRKLAVDLARMVSNSLSAAHNSLLMEAQAKTVAHRLDLLMNSFLDLVSELDENGRYTFVSSGVTQVLGYDPQSLIGVCAFDHVHPDDLERTLWVFAQAMKEGRGSLTVRYLHKNGSYTWLEVFAKVLPLSSESRGRVLLGWRDISEGVTARDVIMSLQQQQEDILNSAGEGIIGLDVNGCHSFVNQAAGEMLGYRPEELLGLPSHATWHHTRKDGTGFPPEECPILSSWKAGEIRKVTDEVFWRKNGTSFPVDYVATPIRAQGKLGGAVVTFRDITERKAKEEELERLAIGLAEARTHENEIGFQIQEELLTGKPPRGIRGASIGSLTVPSFGVDGDFIDFFVHSPQVFDILVGDVMGKGIPAALVGAASKNHFVRAIARMMARNTRDGKPGPKSRSGRRGNSHPPVFFPAVTDIIHRMHAEMTPQLSTLEKFVSATLARFDLGSRTITLVNAGHLPPIQLHAGTGKANLIAGCGNKPLGLSVGEEYKEVIQPFDPGDLIVFHSDGITEARRSGREFFGMDRFISCLAENQGRRPSEIVRKVFETVKSFLGDENPQDDITLVVVSIEDPANKKPLP